MARRDAFAYANELIQAMEAIDPVEIEYHYDNLSDTLVMSVLPQPQPGISVELYDGWMIRVHRDTDQVIGLHIENLLSRVIKDYPDFASAAVGPLTRQTQLDVWDELREVVPQLATASH